MDPMDFMTFTQDSKSREDDPNSEPLTWRGALGAALFLAVVTGLLLWLRG